MVSQHEKKTATRDQFREWLKQGAGPLCLSENSAGHTFIKLPKTDDMEYLFEQVSYHGDGISWHDKFEFFCVHDKRTHALYLGEGETFPHVVEGMRPGDVLDIRDLRKSLQAEVNRIVESQIDNNRNNLSVKKVSGLYAKKDLEYYRQYGADADAVKRFFDGEKSSDIRFKSWYELKGWNEEALLSYLEDSFAHTQAEAARYAAEHQEDFLKQFLENEVLIQRLREIEADTDGPVQRMKRITDAVRDSQAKSVTVTIQKAGQELSFKTEASALLGHHSYYSTYQIAAPDRRRFEAMFGRSADYTAEDITRITYGRNAIYEAAPVEPVQSEAPEQGMTMGGMV